MHSFSARTRRNKEVIINNHILHKKTTLQNTGLFETQDNLIISLRTVEAFGKYACGIFSAETAAAVLRGPAGTKR